MADRGDSGWERTSEAYTPEQVSYVLKECGVDVEFETEHDFLCFCPFHGNTDTPSFSVSRERGTYICFNASCAVKGTLVEFVKGIRKFDEFKSRRLIIQGKTATQVSFREALEAAFTPKVEWTEFPQDKLDDMYKTFWEFPPAVEYMTEQRSFLEETLHTFKVGFSSVRDLITVPMHNPKGLPVGIIGRPIVTKKFKNSRNLPTSKTLWNLHRAQRQGESVIVTESSFDAMRVHQAGYPNVVATLGGNLSPYHIEQLDRNFSTIVAMTDMDKKMFYDPCPKCKAKKLNLCKGHNPGRDLGDKLVDKLPRKKILWASYEKGMVYPHGAKDAGDMTDDEIRQCLRNAVSNYVYKSWGLY